MFLRKILDRVHLISRLQERGWVNYDAAHPRAADDLATFLAVRDYQRYWGLKDDGIAGPVTARHLALPRFCKHPDHMALGRRTAAVAKWPHLNVTVTWDGDLPDVPRSTAMGCLERALKNWSRVCALRPTIATNAKTANIVLQTGQIDGSGKVLAYQQLPFDVIATSRLLGMYDVAEPWSASITPPPTLALVDLDATLFHELGHGWGLDHANGEGAAMSPIYAGLRTAQAWDVAAIQALYPGPGWEEATPAAPVPVSEPPSSSHISARPDPLCSPKARIAPAPCAWSRRVCVLVSP